ncbi:immunoglobulin A1 protease family protein (peptidase_S6 domain) [Campylobacter sp. RM5004]|uniref:autotransporter outer membrane beta-barrel domain-containing protein n=1 Tax=Campylobacter sp. RM5004 TaxID=1660078 RepID=UPI001EFBD498|nr:autotransporter outer membrane beta-barrel domain-containing protein [Campylobacter sp. RM5004]ULO01889.1 immunoglobulin A1 protease family protein (peptidase_S6 domain) [Campylobacter sp. RM5004]
MKIKYSAILLSMNLFAGVVNPNFAYQDYLDFGANKGKFSVGKNISVTNKSGKVVDFKVPMPDFSAANQSGDLMGELTNIGGSYAITAAHMISPTHRPDLINKGKKYEFGNVASSVVASDTNFKDYLKWNDNCKEPQAVDDLRDFAVIKMSKLNINASAKLINREFFYIDPFISENLKNDQNELYKDKFSMKNQAWNKTEYDKYIATGKEQDSEDIGKGILINHPERFSVYARSGSGMQKIGYIDGQLVPNLIEYEGVYLTGGVLYLNKSASTDNIGILKLESVSENRIVTKDFSRLDFSNNPAPGDSGSAVYVYDNLIKDWFVVGVASTSDCNPYETNGYACSTSSYALINHHIINDFKNGFTATLDGNGYDSTTISASIKDKNNENNKDLVFANATTITLNDKENLGSSVFYFNDNSTINGGEVLLGGVVINDGKTLEFNATTGLNDNLHKMGKGSLNINEESLGGLRSGEGLTILNTTNKAFSSIYLLNDAKLKITNENQLKDTNLIFNGGELDLNGVNLSLNKIQANNFNTLITNSNSEESKLNITNPKELDIYHGKIANNISLELNNAKDFVFDGELNLNNLNINNSTINLQGHPLAHAYLYNIQTANKVGANITPTTSFQEDYEARVNNIDNIVLNSANLNILKHSILNAKNITLNNASNLNIGENKIYLDYYDNNHISNGVNDLVFTSSLQEYNSLASNINVNANVVLNNNSSLNIKNGSEFNGSISDDNTSSLNLENANIEANINIANLNATNTNFYFALNKTLKVTNSAMGSLNTFMIKPSLAGENKYLLASINNTNNTIKQDYLKAIEYKENISIYKPNIEFANENGKANWYLVSLKEETQEPEINNPNTPNIEEKPTIKDYFFVEENKAVTQMIDNSLNQVFFSYVLEWNNLQKRMGELRNNTSSGFWTRAYVGESSYKDYNKTKFYEFQLGIDKLNDSNYYKNYTGLVLNQSIYKLGNNLSGDIKGTGFGIYNSTIFDNGFYIDAIAKYINYKNDFTLYVKNQNEVLNSLKAKNSSSLIASVELGYRKDFNNFYLEPQIEFITGYVGKQELSSEDKKLNLKSDSFVPFNIKTALFMGANYEKFALRAGVGYAADLINNAKKTIKDLDSTSIYNGKKDSRAFVNLSNTYKINEKSTLNLEFERTFGGDLNIDYSFNLVYRYSF